MSGWFRVVLVIAAIIPCLYFLVLCWLDSRRRKRDERRMMAIHAKIVSGEYGTMPEFDPKSGEDAALACNRTRKGIK